MTQASWGDDFFAYCAEGPRTLFYDDRSPEIRQRAEFLVDVPDISYVMNDFHTTSNSTTANPCSSATTALTTSSRYGGHQFDYTVPELSWRHADDDRPSQCIGQGLRPGEMRRRFSE
jgi:hypothetical protein